MVSRWRWANVHGQMNEEYASLIAELASGRVTLPVAMEMTLVARFYEASWRPRRQPRAAGD